MTNVNNFEPFDIEFLLLIMYNLPIRQTRKKCKVGSYPNTGKLGNIETFGFFLHKISLLLRGVMILKSFDFEIHVLHINCIQCEI